MSFMASRQPGGSLLTLTCISSRAPREVWNIFPSGVHAA